MKTKQLLAEKLKLKQKKRIFITFSALVITLAFLVGSLLLLNQKSQVKVQAQKATIALVNEDLPATFNKQTYNFGKSFVDLVLNDSTYNWQVVSRSVADKAYSEDSVDAIIYLPQTFSHDLLTLQDIDPTQAKVDYKLQSQNSDL